MTRPKKYQESYELLWELFKKEHPDLDIYKEGHYVAAFADIHELVNAIVKKAEELGVENQNIRIEELL